MTPDEASARLLEMCKEAFRIAMDQGWDATIDARPNGRDGYMFLVHTDRVNKERLRANAQRKMQMTLEETT